MINRKFQIIMWIIYSTILLILYLSTNLNSSPKQNDGVQNNDHFQQLKLLNNKTTQILNRLVKTKYFKILRLNINSQCPLPYMNKLCKSKSCAVCRCDEKDIPENWLRTDKIDSSKFQKQQTQIWSSEREGIHENQKWIWHVEDVENDQGQYFDVDTNIESFSGYNGSYIWSLIYQENCFKGKNSYQQMCREQQLFYQIISGLHTSISTHLSRYYKNITTKPEWADISSEDSNFYYNHEQYKNRVLDHPQRIRNLVFLYELLIKAVKQIIPFLQSHKITSDQITDDLKGTMFMQQFIRVIKAGGAGLGELEHETYGMFSSKKTKKQIQEKGILKNYLEDNHIKQYQKYIHNISRILNCVQCEKCRLFGKMQTYGLGTALKILLGYNKQLKRNQLVALINTLNKISISVNTYFEYEELNLPKASKSQSKKQKKSKDQYIFVKVWGSCGIVLLLFIEIAMKYKGSQKMNRKFDLAFKRDHSNIKIQ